MTVFELFEDVTPPTTTGALASLPAADDGTLSLATPTLATTDPLPGSGVAATYYTLVAHSNSAPSTASLTTWNVYSGPLSIPARVDSDVYAFGSRPGGNAETPR